MTDPVRLLLEVVDQEIKNRELDQERTILKLKRLRKLIQEQVEKMEA